MDLMLYSREKSVIKFVLKDEHPGKLRFICQTYLEMKEKVSAGLKLF